MKDERFLFVENLCFSCSIDIHYGSFKSTKDVFLFFPFRNKSVPIRQLENIVSKFCPLKVLLSLTIPTTVETPAWEATEIQESLSC